MGTFFVSFLGIFGRQDMERYLPSLSRTLQTNTPYDRNPKKKSLQGVAIHLGLLSIDASILGLAEESEQTEVSHSYSSLSVFEIYSHSRERKRERELQNRQKILVEEREDDGGGKISKSSVPKNEKRMTFVSKLKVSNSLRFSPLLPSIFIDLLSPILTESGFSRS